MIDDMAEAIAELDCSDEITLHVLRHLTDTMKDGKPTSTYAPAVQLPGPFTVWPSTPRERDYLPIGLRSRDNITIACPALLKGESKLRPDEIVVDAVLNDDNEIVDGLRYRVSALANWKKQGNFYVAVCTLMDESEDEEPAP